MKEIADNLASTMQLITEAATACGRDPSEVQLVAVSKRKPVEAVQAAYSAGHRDFGENRIQELQEKAPALPDDIRWHMIGTLQRNKVRQAIDHSYMIHSVDSAKLLQRIDRLAGEMKVCQKILLQANISGESTKAGLDLDALKTLTEQALACPNVMLCGYMTMAPFGASSEELREIFGSLRDFRDRVETLYDVSLRELSMGMSGDFREAILCGATMVRIGTAIFGKRDH